MIFSDEKFMWYADSEVLACKLANKSQEELQDIFDKSDIIKLRVSDSSKQSSFNRIMFVLLIIPLLILSIIKWFLTGDRFLDSYAKKYKIIGFIFKIVGGLK